MFNERLFNPEKSLLFTKFFSIVEQVVCERESPLLVVGIFLQQILYSWYLSCKLEFAAVCIYAGDARSLEGYPTGL